RVFQAGASLAEARSAPLGLARQRGGLARHEFSRRGVEPRAKWMRLTLLNCSVLSGTEPRCRQMSGSTTISSPTLGVLPGSRPSVPETLRLTVNDAPEHERLEIHRDFFRRQGIRYGSTAKLGRP